MQCSVWLLALASGLGQRAFLQQTESGRLNAYVASGERATAGRGWQAPSNGSAYTVTVGWCKTAKNGVRDMGKAGQMCNCGNGAELLTEAACFAKATSAEGFIAGNLDPASGCYALANKGGADAPACPDGCSTFGGVNEGVAPTEYVGEGAVGKSCMMCTDCVVAPPDNTAELLWPRLVGDVQRTELKVNRLRARMAKLNARIDAVLNRTGNTQPIVLSFKDRAIVTGTLAQQNNFTILALKPRADLMAPVFKESETLVANDTADVAKDQGMLGETPELEGMQRNLTIFGVELENVVPAIEKFDNVTHPMESFLKETHPVIIRRAVDKAMNDFLGDTLSAMASHLEAAPAP